LDRIEEEKKRNDKINQAKLKDKEAFELKQSELKGLTEGKAAEKARKEKDLRVKIVTDLILFDKKHVDHAYKKEEALLQKKEIAAISSIKAANGYQRKFEEQTKKEEDTLNAVV